MIFSNRLMIHQVCSKPLLSLSRDHYRTQEFLRPVGIKVEGWMTILLSILVILAPGKKRASLTVGCAEGG